VAKFLRILEVTKIINKDYTRKNCKGKLGKEMKFERETRTIIGVSPPLYQGLRIQARKI
jgi:hypothetical protein